MQLQIYGSGFFPVLKLFYKTLVIAKFYNSRSTGRAFDSLELTGR